MKERNCNRCKKSLNEDTNRQNKDVSTKINLIWNLN